MKKYIYTLLALAIAQQAQAQEINKIITKPYVEKLISTLSSDEMQGRATFSPGIDKAATFIESEFKAIGLKPLMGEKDFRQTFYKYKLKPLSAKVIIDGNTIDAANVLAYGANGETLTFDKTAVPDVIKMDPNKPFMDQFRPFTKSTKKQLVLVDAKFADAFKRIKDRLEQGSVVDEKDMANGSATVFVLNQDAVNSNYSVEVKNSVTKMPLFNVGGMIPGKSKEKEIVVFSGHYDHLGIMKADGQDSIANGADDDASGTTAMIALAKYYKKLNNNERTLIFVAFTAEEIGGFGAKYFSSKLNPDNVVAMFNIEMIGKDSKFGKNTAFITGFDKSDFGAILQKNLKGTEFTFHPDPYPAQNLFYRSDNATLAALGVPAHTISTDQIDSDKLYHTVKDEFSSLDVENILATIKGIAKSAITIIKGIDTPTRIPKLTN
ncbi:MAG: M20/M25/M40 family metallo-hydrolase [Bacteroidota bacterium]